MKFTIVFTGRQDSYVFPHYFKDPEKAEKFYEDNERDVYEDIVDIDTDNIRFED